MTSQGSPRSLQELIDSVPDLVDYLYNDTPGPHGRTTAGLTPVPAEFTNWRDEQRAWREAAVLFDQSHHMPELFLHGPDARRLLSDLGVNSLANLRPGIAKQYIGCNRHGQMIGDCVLHDLGNETFELISGKPLLNWIQFNAETGGYDVSVERDENTSDNTTGRRRNFRFGLDGPHAGTIFREIVEGDVPELKFFRTAYVKVAGHEVMALRHGMAGHQGVELSGPYEYGPEVRAAIVEAGLRYGIKPGGTKAYYSSALESGWIGYPLPAIYSDDELRAYREWLPADSWEAKFAPGGSFRSSSIEDYYLTPYDMGYDNIVKFDHDFTGRSALEAIAERPPRRKVTLVWNSADVARVVASLLEPGLHYRYLEFPVADYGFPQGDEVRSLSGNPAGRSTQCGYSANEYQMLSLAIVDAQYAEPGTEVVVIWGEPDGGSRKPRIERHDQTQIRATVAPVPYAQSVQHMKRASISSPVERA
jgi:vanillate/3-O-methylgallate O-demethylase